MKPTKTLPCEGQVWCRYTADSSPFPPKYEKHKTVKIIDFKKGWVRYYMDPLHPDERMDYPTFARIYCLMPT